MHLARADATYFHQLILHYPEGHWTLHAMGLEPPGPKAGVVMEPKAQGFIARGAWRVQCPLCSGTQFGDPNVDRFCCCDCGNANIGSRWLTVAWPADPDAIETALLARKNPQRMNWLPHEAVEHLHAENVEHDVYPLSEVPKDQRTLVKLLVDAGKEVAPVHAIAPGTIVHPDSEWHAANHAKVLKTMGRNVSESDMQRALMIVNTGR